MVVRCVGWGERKDREIKSDGDGGSSKGASRERKSERESALVDSVRSSVITMASVKDTATFFAEGTSNQFEHVLKLYPQALRVKAIHKTKKPEELIKLDNW